ncbi:insulin-like growth factor I, juvenile form isoform X2 [Leguminivora glycinivorella]|uniref:insulin-like growth factor I, juvenile form isoform X2 n=1 Tax=Leguminivora glycinivorella TaxID=1035111 RepID=UPI002010770C|nr:insulin-like growth factor I, juvenile form isoform X2 [Leguminivora glycinivorella]
MLLNCVVLLAAAWALQPAETATSHSVKLCGRKLSEIMSRVCHVYNSPSWGDPTVEQPGMRRKRQAGIADQCCTFGCTWEQLNEYCAISSNSEATLSELNAHSMEYKRAVQPAGAPAAAESPPAPPEVGRRSRGYGRGGARCWCRRKRRSGRRRTLTGNMVRKQINDSPEPVVGTVSPVLTWGRTLNTDLPPMERDRYNYIAVYS